MKELEHKIHAARIDFLMTYLNMTPGCQFDENACERLIDDLKKIGLRLY